MTYSIDYRKKVLSIRKKEGLSIGEAATRFGVGTTTIVNWLKRIVAKTKRNKPATRIDMEALRLDVKNYPDGYLAERANRLGVSKNGIWWALKRIEVTYKKKPKTSKEIRRREAYLPE